MAQKTIVTHGVIRVTGTGVAIDGRAGNVAFVIPPREVVIEGPDDMVIESYGPLADCTLAELQDIRDSLGVATSSRTVRGLRSAVTKHVNGHVNDSLDPGGV